MVRKKPYKLSFDERPSYLYVRVSCDKASPEMALAYIGEIVAECRELGYHRVIVERDIPEALPIKAAISVSLEIAKLATPDIKIAGVDRRIENRYLNKFEEFVGKSRGLNVGFFTDIAKARRWLLEDLRSAPSH